jgi:hypothetical protein
MYSGGWGIFVGGFSVRGRGKRDPRDWTQPSLDSVPVKYFAGSPLDLGQPLWEFV